METKFVQAKHYTPADRRLETINLIVIHDMEAPQGVHTAENVADWFAGVTAPQASAHICVDEDSIVRTCRTKDVAWAAPNGNQRGYQVELAGRAKNATRVWLDKNNTAMLELAAEWTANKCHACNIIPHKMTNDEHIYEAMSKDDSQYSGFVGHVDISRISAARHLPGDHTHTDPGDNFPWTHFMNRVKFYYNK